MPKINHYFKQFIILLLIFSITVSHFDFKAASNIKKAQLNESLMLMANQYLNELDFDDTFELVPSGDTISDSDSLYAEIFDELDPIAQLYFLKAIRLSDEELLEIHKDKVDSSIMFEENESMISSYSFASLQSSLVQLGRELSMLGLPAAVRYALMGAASSIAAGAGTAFATIGVGTIIAAITTAGCAVVIIMNWQIIKSRWSQITAAFQRAFHRNSTSVSTAFYRSGLGYVDNYNDIFQIKNIYRDRSYRNQQWKNTSFKHLHLDLLRHVLNSSPGPFEAYYSTNKRIVLMKFKIGFGTKALINSSFGKDGAPYELQNYDVSGATLYVLWDLKNKSIFHAHIRLASSMYHQRDTITMRKVNQLDWRLLSLPMQHDPYYKDCLNPGAFFPENQVR